MEMMVACDDDRALVRFPDLADFHLRDGWSLIHGAPASQAPSGMVRHRLLDWVIPLTLGAQGELVLHAGAVVVDGSVALILGPSGHGKSTLVSALARHGIVAMSDDAVRLYRRSGTWFVVPSYSGVRLWSDSVDWVGAPLSEFAPIAENSNKQRWAGGTWSSPTESFPLGHLILLRVDDSAKPNGDVQMFQSGRRAVC
jgi:hypothetical protein